MAVTKSWERETVVALEELESTPRERRRELPWLLGASALILAGLLLTAFAKTEGFQEACVRLSRRELLNLNALANPDELTPFLITFRNQEERRKADRKSV